MQIRRLTEEDAASYRALRLEAIEREPRSFGPTPEEYREVTLQETRVFLGSPETFVIGAFDGVPMIGAARFDREQGAKERHKGHVRGVYVRASYRGQGVAKALLRALVDQVKVDPTVEQVMLAVGVFNTGAKKVYESLGFRTFGLEPRALRVADEYVDEEHMILRLRDVSASE